MFPISGQNGLPRTYRLPYTIVQCSAKLLPEVSKIHILVSQTKLFRYATYRGGQNIPGDLNRKRLRHFRQGHKHGRKFK